MKNHQDRRARSHHEVIYASFASRRFRALRAKIIGVGRYRPRNIVANNDEVINIYCRHTAAWPPKQCDESMPCVAALGGLIKCW